MKKVTPEHAEEILEDMARLRVESDIDLGPPVMLRRIFRHGGVTWEILPKFIAEWTLHAISENEPEVARARLFRSPPKEAPSEIAAKWIYHWLAQEKARGRLNTFS